MKGALKIIDHLPLSAAAAAALLLCALPACSLINDPDRSKLGQTDGGTSRSELLCVNGVDDDNDALTDCADLDCAQQPVCCEDVVSIVEVTDWNADPTSGEPSERFALLPTADAQRPTVESEDGRSVITGFAPSDIPRGVLAERCVPAALGAAVRLEAVPKGDARCTSDAPCDRYAALVITTVDDMAPGAMLLDDLAVRVYAGGYVAATQAGTELASTTVPTGSPIEATARLITQVDEGTPTLFARVTLGAPGTEGDALLADFPVLPLRDLRTDGTCNETPGIRFAVEGQGASVSVGPVSAERQNCVTPGQFSPPLTTLMSETLNYSVGWTDGTISSPSLATSRTSPTSVQWDIFAEGTNDPPELSEFTHIGYSIGHARATHPDGLDWPPTSIDWTSSGDPKAGDNPPSCARMGGPCDANRSVREPFVYIVRAADDTAEQLILAVAREEVGSGGDRDLFALHVRGGVQAPTVPVSLGDALLSPSELPDCISLRDPALIPVDSGDREGYWLTFTCERAAEPSEIQAVRLFPSLALMRDNGGTPIRETLITTDMLGAFAEQGVRGGEPVVTFDENAALIRIWFLAQAVSGEVSVGLAEGQFLDALELRNGLPVMTPFPVNPVLRNTDPRPGATVACPMPSMCTITGIAVARRIDEPDRMRFLLARHVNNSSPGVDEFIPLEQQVR